MRRFREISRREYLRAAERQLEAARTLEGRLGRALARAALRYVEKAFKKAKIPSQHVKFAQAG